MAIYYNNFYKKVEFYKKTPGYVEIKNFIWYTYKSKESDNMTFSSKIKKEVSTTMLPRIRNIAGIFELVNYDFNKVFDMMYPEYADESMYVFAAK